MTTEQELKKYKILVEITKLYAGHFRACLDCPTENVFRQKDGPRTQHDLVSGVVKILQTHNINPEDAERVGLEKAAASSEQDGFCFRKNPFRPEEYNGFGKCISIEQFVDMIESLF